jgi:hypothetical protein
VIDFLKNVPISISYCIVFYFYLAAVHLYITLEYLNGTTWYFNIFKDIPQTIIMFVVVPILFGTVLLVGLVKKKIPLIKLGLAASWLYHLLLCFINILYFNFTGTPWVPALFAGIVSLLIYCYYTIIY